MDDTSARNRVGSVDRTRRTARKRKGKQMNIFDLIQWHEENWKECEREQGEENNAEFHRLAVEVLSSLPLGFALTAKGNDLS